MAYPIRMNMLRTLRVLTALLSIMIGIYPIAYFLVDRRFGLLNTKSEALLNDYTWNLAFYTHIIGGGIALMLGWLQFMKHFRERNLAIHRRVGYVYLVSVLLSGIAGIYIGFFATGGIVAAVGFISLGMIWLLSTGIAYYHIVKGDWIMHERAMYFSYAACWAAVMLRIWLPLLSAIFQDFIIAYRIVAWLCWVPNLVVAYLIVSSGRMKARHIFSA